MLSDTNAVKIKIACKPCSCNPEQYPFDCPRHQDRKTEHIHNLCKRDDKLRAEWDRRGLLRKRGLPIDTICPPCNERKAKLRQSSSSEGAEPEQRQPEQETKRQSGSGEQQPEQEPATHTAQKLILKSFLSPGDIVMMTAAVRELHRQHSGQYLTDVRTPFPAIWEHNPDIHPIDDDDQDARHIDLHYPLINQSNQRPIHFLEGYCDYLAGQLGLPHLRPQSAHGHIYLSDAERGWMSIPHERFQCQRYWVIDAGGKLDFTTKHWIPQYFQDVVDHFRGRIQFVQIGVADDHWHRHPDLRGVIDLRGKTDLRQLIRLIHSASGVLTGISLPMHLAAAVPRPDWIQRLRPCVVVGGGREPPAWTQYPGHRWLSTIGCLPCCAEGGCWKARTVKLHDGKEQDKDGSICERSVNGYGRCMWLIEPADVIRAIEGYLHADL